MSNRRDYQIDLATHPFCIAMKEQRLKLGYSFRALADRIGSSSRQYLAELEDGKWVVSVEMGMQICQALSIPTYFCVDYIKQGTSQRTEIMITKQYTDWVDATPEVVWNELLQTEGSRGVHHSYYNKELVKC